MSDQMCAQRPAFDFYARPYAILSFHGIAAEQWQRALSIANCNDIDI